MYAQEEKESKKLFNFRFFTILLFFCALGVTLAIIFYNAVIFDYIISIVSGTVILAVLFLYRKRGVALAVFILFFAIFYLYTVGVLSSRVSDDTNYSESYMQVRINYVSVDESVAYCSIPEGEGKLTVKEVEGLTLKEGMTVTLQNVTVNAIKATDGKGNFDFYSLTNRARYSVYADCVYAIDEFSPDIAESVRIGIKESGSTLPKEIKGIVVALLTGDKYGIENNTYSDYRRSGLAHILAVSGMHVVFLYSAVELLFKKCRIRKRIRAFLSVPVLFLFCMTCGFSPSVVRASLMTSLHKLIPSISCKRYDSLSSMSLAGVILLIFNPMTLFSYGFLLSFLAVFGITAFSDKVKRLFSFLPKYLGEMLSVSICANLATIPLSALFFGEISTLSLICNVLVLPVMSVFYGVLFACAIITVIFPFMNILLVALGSAVYYMNMVTGMISALPFATVKAFPPSWFIVGYYGGGVLLSDYVFLKKDIKRAIGVLFVTMIFCYLIIG